MEKQNCGLQHNYQGLDIYAETDKKTFTNERLRYKTKDYKVPTFQACVYKFMTPPGGYTGGKVYLTIKKPESGVTLYLTMNGKNVGPVPYDSEISVKTSESFTVTAVPKKDSYKTSFSMEYRTDGTKNEDAPIFEKLKEH